MPSLKVAFAGSTGAVLAAAGAIAEVRAVATLNAPYSPDHVTRQFADGIGLIERELTFATRAKLVEIADKYQPSGMSRSRPPAARASASRAIR